MRTIERDIVGAFIFSSDEQLLLGKNIEGGVYQDKWLVPGGGINPGEPPRDALTREVREEVGIDIADARITPLEGVSYGQSEKRLRDTGEVVTVKMTFHDFVVRLLTDAKNTRINTDDDLSHAQWFAIEELGSLELAPGTSNTLKRLGLIH